MSIPDRGAPCEPAPLLTLELQTSLLRSARLGEPSVECSLDLGRTLTRVVAHDTGWGWGERRYPYVEHCKERTIYYWDGEAFRAAVRFSTSLIKLVPSEWGAPTFEIDGIKMLPTSTVSPYVDARRKVEAIQPRAKSVLDTCGGLGYFAAWCLRGGARRVASFEKNPDVIWLRSLNPWSPEAGGEADSRLQLTCADILERIGELPSGEFDAVLHDPPRFGIAGELYSQSFYDQLARVLKRKGRLFHYIGTPNKLTSGRDVPREVTMRLRHAGFVTRFLFDGVLAVKQAR